MAVDVTVFSDGVLKAGLPHKLFPITPIAIGAKRNTWDVAPDGQRFLIHTAQEQTDNSIPPLTVVVNFLSGGKLAQ
jgi:hypothetical protein